MDKDLKLLLENAKKAGATDDDLRSLITMYEADQVKKKGKPQELVSESTLGDEPLVVPTSEKEEGVITLDTNDLGQAGSNTGLLDGEELEITDRAKPTVEDTDVPTPKPTEEITPIEETKANIDESISKPLPQVVSENIEEVKDTTVPLTDERLLGVDRENFKSIFHQDFEYRNKTDEEKQAIESYINETLEPTSFTNDSKLYKENKNRINEYLVKQTQLDDSQIDLNEHYTNEIARLRGENEQQDAYFNELSMGKGVYGGFWNTEDETTTFNDDLRLELLNPSSVREAKLGNKVQQGDGTVDDKEELLSLAKGRMLNRQHEALTSIYKTTSEEDMTPATKKQLEEAKQAYYADVAKYTEENGTRIKSSFGATIGKTNFQEKFSDSPTADVVSTFTNSLMKMIGTAIASPIDIAKTIYEGTGLRKLKEGDDYDPSSYGTSDKWSDVAGFFAEQEYTPQSLEKYKLIDSEGEFDFSVPGVAKGVAQSAPFMIGVAYSAKGRSKLMEGMLNFGKDPKRMSQLYRTMLASSALTIRDNVKAGEDMGLVGKEAATYGSFLSAMEGLTGTIMPDIDFFAKPFVKVANRTLAEAIKKASGKQAIGNAMKQWLKSITGEITEEEAMLLATSIANSVALQEQGLLDDFLDGAQQKETLAVTIATAGLMGSPKLVSDYKGRKKELIDVVLDNRELTNKRLDEDSKDFPENKERNEQFKSTLNDMSKAIVKAPDNANAQVIELLIEKNKLEEEKKTKDKSFHDSYNTKIEAVDVKIAESMKERSDFFKEEKKKTKEANKIKLDKQKAIDEAKIEKAKEEEKISNLTGRAKVVHELTATGRASETEINDSMVLFDAMAQTYAETTGGTIDQFYDDRIKEITTDESKLGVKALKQATGVKGVISPLELSKLSLAYKYTHQGKSPLEIKIETGWEQGLDGEWRQEVNPIGLDIDTGAFKEVSSVHAQAVLNGIKPKNKFLNFLADRTIGKDSKSKKEYAKYLLKNEDNFNNAQKLANATDKEMEQIRPLLEMASKGVTWNVGEGKSKGVLELNVQLKDVLTGDILDRYPQLKDKEFKFRVISKDTHASDRGNVFVGGQATSDGIKLFGNKGVNTLKDYLSRTKEDKQSKMVHEVQHMIQNIEGFQPGANTETIVKKVTDRLKDLSEIEEDANNRYIEVLQNPKEYTAKYTEDTKNLYLAAVEQYTNFYESVSDGDGAIKDAYTLYQSTLGEAEARAMQARAEMTPEERSKTLMGDSVKEALGGNKAILFQETKGAISFDEQGKATIALFEGADVSTILHEFVGGHLGRRVLEDLAKVDEGFARDYETAKTWAGVVDDVWTVEAEEKFARGWERYIRTGTAPSKSLQNVFDVLSKALKKIYKVIRDSELDVKITPEVRGVFDRMLTGQVVKEKATVKENIEDVSNKIISEEKLTSEETKAVNAEKPKGETVSEYLYKAVSGIVNPVSKAVKQVVERLAKKIRLFTIGMALASATYFGGVEIVQSPLIRAQIEQTLGKDMLNVMDMPMSDVIELIPNAVDKFTKTGAYAETVSDMTTLYDEVAETETLEDIVKEGAPTVENEPIIIPETERFTEKPINIGKSVRTKNGLSVTPMVIDMSQGEVTIELADNTRSKNKKNSFKGAKDAHGVMGATNVPFTSNSEMDTELPVQLTHNSDTGVIKFKKTSDVQANDKVAVSKGNLVAVDDLNITPNKEGGFDIETTRDNANGTTIIATKTGGLFHIGLANGSKAGQTIKSQNSKGFMAMRGGMVVFGSSDGKISVAVSGSVNDIFRTLTELQTKYPNKKFYIFRGDTGTHNTPGMKSDGKVTTGDIKTLSARNTYGDNEFWILKKQDSTKKTQTPKKETRIPFMEMMGGLLAGVRRRRNDGKTDFTTEDILRDVASALRKAKFTQSIKDLSKLSANPLGVVAVVWDGAIEIVASSLEGGANLKVAIGKGVAKIKSSQWYKSATAKVKKQAIVTFKEEAIAKFESLTNKKTVSAVYQKLANIESSLTQAKKELNSLRTRLENSRQIQKAARAYARKLLTPKQHKLLRSSDFSKLITGIGKALTEKSLENFKKKAVEVVDRIIAEDLNNSFDKLVKTKLRVEGRNSIVGETATAVLNLLKGKNSLLTKTYAELDALAEATTDENVLTAIDIARTYIKANNARLASSTHKQLKSAIKQLGKVITDGVGDVKALSEAFEAHTEDIIEKSASDTSKKTDVERGIIKDVEQTLSDIRTGEELNLDEVKVSAIDAINKMKKAYPKINIAKEIEAILLSDNSRDIQQALNSAYSQFSKRADFKGRKRWSTSPKSAIINLLNSLQSDVKTMIAFVSKKGSTNMSNGYLQQEIDDRLRRVVHKNTEIKEKANTMIGDAVKRIYGKKHKLAKLAMDLMGTVVENSHIKIDTGITRDGEPLIITRGSLMWMYNQYKNPANKIHFDKAGFTPELMQNLIDNNLSKEDIAFADFLVKDFYPTIYPMVNAVYREMYYTNLPMNEFYSGKLEYDERSKSDADKENDLLDTLQKGSKDTGMFFGSIKDRSKNNNPISTETNIIENLYSYIDEMGKFVSSATYYRDVMNILNSKEVKQNMKEYTSKSINARLKERIEASLGVGAREKTNAVLNFLIQAKMRASLAFTPKLAFQQIMSTTLWLVDEPGAVIKGALGNPFNNLKALNEIWNNSAAIRKRYKGNWSSLETSYIENQSKFANRYRAARFMGKGLDIGTKIAFAFTIGGDYGGMMILGAPYYNMKKKEGLKMFNGDEQKAIEYAIDKFHSIADKTQQSYETKDRDAMQTTNFGKAMNMYGNSPKQYNRNFIQAMIEINRSFSRKGEVKGTLYGNVWKAFMNHSVQGMLYQWAGGALLGLLGDEDEDESKWADIIWKGAVFGSFSKFLLLGDAVEAIYNAFDKKRYASVLPAFLSTLEDIVNAVYGMSATEEGSVTYDENVKDLQVAGAELLGVPVKKSVNMHKNIMDVVEYNDVYSTEELIVKLGGWSDYQFDNLNEVTRAEAVIRKKDKKAERQKEVDLRARDKMIRERIDRRRGN